MDFNKYSQKIIELKKKIYNQDSISNDIIDFITQNNININSYLPVIGKNNELIPLIYECCRFEKYTKLFNFLIKYNVKLDAKIINGDDIDLLLYSHNDYIKSLIKYGCVLNKKSLTSHIVKLIICGNYIKLSKLIKHNAINSDDIDIIIQFINKNNVIFDIIAYLMQYIVRISRNEICSNENYKNIIKNYSDIFIFLLNYNVSFNKKINDVYFPQLILDSYHYDIIKIFMNADKNLFQNTKLHHYTCFDLDIRKLQKNILNEHNFTLIKSLYNHNINTPKSIRKININN
jgi:hypothetical protein